MKIEKILKEIDELIIAREYSRAEIYLLQVMEKYPEHPEIHYLLGDVYCKLSLFELAVEHEKIANKILPGNPQILDLLGWAYFMNGDISEGRKHMQLALKINPDDIRLLCDLTVLETHVGSKRALDYARKALILAPHDSMVQEIASAAQIFITSKERMKNKSRKKAQN
ncbi:MAG: tetratricopeptide repeat protein [Candidatus Levyibacteriota bacterium]